MKMSLTIVNQMRRTFLRKMRKKKEDTDYISNLKKYINSMLNFSQNKQESMKCRFPCQ